jgi:hypothetical protein
MQLRQFSHRKAARRNLRLCLKEEAICALPSEEEEEQKETSYCPVYPSVRAFRCPGSARG